MDEPKTLLSQSFIMWTSGTAMHTNSTFQQGPGFTGLSMSFLEPYRGTQQSTAAGSATPALRDPVLGKADPTTIDPKEDILFSFEKLIDFRLAWTGTRSNCQI